MRYTLGQVTAIHEALIQVEKRLKEITGHDVSTQLDYGSPLVIRLANTKNENRKKQIIKLVCDEYGVSYEELKANGRKGMLPDARTMASYLLATDVVGKATSTEIGILLCKDHSTILYHIEKGRNLLHVDDPRFCPRYFSIAKKLSQ